MIPASFFLFPYLPVPVVSTCGTLCLQDITHDFPNQILSFFSISISDTHPLESSKPGTSARMHRRPETMILIGMMSEVQDSRPWPTGVASRPARVLMNCYLAKAGSNVDRGDVYGTLPSSSQPHDAEKTKTKFRVWSKRESTYAMTISDLLNFNLRLDISMCGQCTRSWFLALASEVFDGALDRRSRCTCIPAGQKVRNTTETHVLIHRRAERVPLVRVATLIIIR